MLDENIILNIQNMNNKYAKIKNLLTIESQWDIDWKTYFNKKNGKPREKKLDARKKMSTEIDKLNGKYN